MASSLDSSSFYSRMRGRFDCVCIIYPLLSSFHNRKHANVDDASAAAKAAKVSEDEIEKAKAEWASIQFSDDESIVDE
jgi:hypothetical protein